MSAELAFNRSQDVDYGVAQEVGPGIRRIVVNNPGPYTFLGTNSYVVGSGEVAVIDPGPADERHLKAIAAAIKGECLAYILITHSHRDHCEARPCSNSRRKTPMPPPRRALGATGLGDAFVDRVSTPTASCRRHTGKGLRRCLHSPAAPGSLAAVGKRPCSPATTMADTTVIARRRQRDHFPA
jgi:hypothetical protein